MNREIKFRAWNKTFKSFSYFSLQDIKDDKRHIEFIYNINKVQQFTGLKDKNGKDIYEGDVVRFTRQQGYSYLHKGSIVKIGWFNFQYTGFGINENIPLTEKRSNELEVIGNIFENPELINHPLT